jgi:hypothetical protein
MMQSSLYPTVSNAEFLCHLVGEDFRIWDDKCLWIAGFACDPGNALPANWAGWPVNGTGSFPLGSMNSYFSIGVFRVGGKRRKDSQCAVFAIVLDDISTDALSVLPLEPTYVLETSPFNHQVGYSVGMCTELDRATRLYAGLIAKGLAKADGSGNNVVRYVRLPEGCNTKGKVVREIGEPFACRIREFEPSRRYGLEDIAIAFDVDEFAPSAAGPFVAESSTDAELQRLIRTGEAFHDPCTRLCARLAGRGMLEPEIVATVCGLMDETREHIPTDRAERWVQERSEVPRYASEAIRKYGERRRAATPLRASEAVSRDDFYAYLPEHKYIFRPTRELWLTEGVNGRLAPVVEGAAAIKPNRWLDLNRPVEQITWAPSEPEILDGKIIQEGGFVDRAGVRAYNLYRAPWVVPGDAHAAGRWRDHLRRLYGDDADDIERWFAHRVQRPGEKINHVLIFGGRQGVGKDTILEPVKRAVGPWNWKEISPAMVMGRFNGWAKAVVVRVSEVRDLGDVDRYAFYEHCKVYAAAPPDVLTVDEKNLREHSIPNVLGLIMTTNDAVNGLYLPPDDRRHFVVNSSLDRGEFPVDYFPGLYAWYEGGGYGNVAAFLRSLDLRSFDPKAPPRKTDAFRAIVLANAAPEEGELGELLEGLGHPDVVTLTALRQSAELRRLHDVVALLTDPKRRRAIAHRLAECGYDPVANPERQDGLWRVQGYRGAIYARRDLALRERVVAARQLCASAVLR